MKKIYILAIAAFAFTLNMNAQFEDDFESYDEGTITDQADNFVNWSGDGGGAESGTVTTEQASNGTKSMYVTTGNDFIFDFDGGVSGGIHTWQYNLYLNDGSTGFLGLMSSGPQDDSTFGAGLYINEPNNASGSGIFIEGAITGDFFDIPEGEWVTVAMIMDLDEDTMSVTVGGSEVYNGPLALEGQGLVAADIWDNGGADFYMDEYIFVEGTLGAEDFNADVFSVYPNPVVNTLNINSADAVQNVTVYDVLGKVVMNLNPGVVSPSLDMSALSSGAYIVNVTINGTSKSVKVIK
jgi:hypothetical protein